MKLRTLGNIAIRVGACVLVFGGDLYQLWRERRREQKRKPVRLCVNDHDALGKFGR